MEKCKKCGSNRIEFRREDLGFKKTSHGSRREHQSVGFCKNCGYTWVTKSGSQSPYGLLFVIPVLILIGMFVYGRINDIHQKTTTKEYTVTSDNIHLVTNPSESYIISKLKTIDGIIEVAPATLEHDPNKMLNDKNGYTSAVFFSYDKINQENASEEDSILEKGTDAGGCIEVFRNEQDAISRNKQLGLFGVSGSHVIIGTVIVRTSSLLSYQDQDELENKICKALLDE